MDGSVRQLAPLSAALNLGARRILVIAVGQFSGQRASPAAETDTRRSRRRRGTRCRRSSSTISRRTSSAACRSIACSSWCRLIARRTRPRPRRRAGARAVARSRRDGAGLRRSPAASGAHAAACVRQHAPAPAPTSRRTSCSTARSAARSSQLGYEDTMARRDDVVAFLADATRALLPELRAGDRRRNTRRSLPARLRRLGSAGWRGCSRSCRRCPRRRMR